MARPMHACLGLLVCIAAAGLATPEAVIEKAVVSGVFLGGAKKAAVSSHLQRILQLTPDVEIEEPKEPADGDDGALLPLPGDAADAALLLGRSPAPPALRHTSRHELRDLGHGHERGHEHGHEGKHDHDHGHGGHEEQQRVEYGPMTHDTYERLAARRRSALRSRLLAAGALSEELDAYLSEPPAHFDDSGIPLPAAPSDAAAASNPPRDVIADLEARLRARSPAAVKASSAVATDFGMGSEAAATPTMDPHLKDAGNTAEEDAEAAATPSMDPHLSKGNGGGASAAADFEMGSEAAATPSMDPHLKEGGGVTGHAGAAQANAEAAEARAADAPAASPESADAWLSRERLRSATAAAMEAAAARLHEQEKQQREEKDQLHHQQHHHQQQQQPRKEGAQPGGKGGAGPARPPMTEAQERAARLAALHRGAAAAAAASREASAAAAKAAVRRAEMELGTPHLDYEHMPAASTHGSSSGDVLPVPQELLERPIPKPAGAQQQQQEEEEEEKQAVKDFGAVGSGAEDIPAPAKHGGQGGHHQRSELERALMVEGGVETHGSDGPARPEGHEAQQAQRHHQHSELERALMVEEVQHEAVVEAEAAEAAVAEAEAAQSRRRAAALDEIRRQRAAADAQRAAADAQRAAAAGTGPSKTTSSKAAAAAKAAAGARAAAGAKAAKRAAAKQQQQQQWSALDYVCVLALLAVVPAAVFMAVAVVEELMHSSSASSAAMGGRLRREAGTPLLLHWFALTHALWRRTRRALAAARKHLTGHASDLPTFADERDGPLAAAAGALHVFWTHVRDLRGHVGGARSSHGGGCMSAAASAASAASSRRASVSGGGAASPFARMSRASEAGQGLGLGAGLVSGQDGEALVLQADDTATATALAELQLRRRH